MPQNKMQIGIYSNLLDVKLRTIAYGIFEEHQLQPSTAYLPVRDVASDAAAAEALNGCVDPAIARLLRRYCSSVLTEARQLFQETVGSLEIWTTLTSRHDDKVLIHVDNDEKLRKETGRTRCPIFGSVLYLGPSEGMNEGGTFFVLPESPAWKPDALLFKPAPWSAVDPALKMDGLYVPFRVGRTVLFEGSIPHCITPFSALSSQSPRVTLLVNGWADPIVGTDAV